MTTADLQALAPQIVLAAATVVAVVAVSLRRSHGLAAGCAVAGLALATLAVWPAAQAAPRAVTMLLVADAPALFFGAVISLAGLVVALLGHGYLARRRERREEFYLLLLLATFGASVLVVAEHFAALLLGLETLSVALYGLIGYLRRERLAGEAAIKYLILAGVATASLVLGMAFIYAETGSLRLPEAATALAAGTGGWLVAAGVVLLVAGLGFKLALVPFHLWTPDVYAGAPAPVTAFVATVSKSAVFVVLLRTLHGTDPARLPALTLVLAVIAGASMIAGNLLALLQSNLQRLLAYSSIAHLGYLLVALLAGGTFGAAAAAFYLVAYVVTLLLAFGVVALLTRPQHETLQLDDLRGLFWTRPGLASLLTGAVLSLAGLPLTAGFVAKITLMAAGAERSFWTLLLLLVAGSAIGAFYYLRVLLAMLAKPAQGAGEAAAAEAPAAPIASGFVLALLALLLVWLGLQPAPLQSLIASVVQAWS
jgi:NADH-quinone oxidoreductase subunit N